MKKVKKNINSYKGAFSRKAKPSKKIFKAPKDDIQLWEIFEQNRKKCTSNTNVPFVNNILHKALIKKFRIPKRKQDKTDKDKKIIYRETRKSFFERFFFKKSLANQIL